MPGVPTFTEAGLAGVNAESYWGVYAPAGTPRPVLEVLGRLFARALRQQAVLTRLVGLGYEAIGNTPEEHSGQLRHMVEAWTSVIARANITLD